MIEILIKIIYNKIKCLKYEVKALKIQEFIKHRGVSYQAVRQYIKNHPHLFEGHIGRRNKIVLDEVAVTLLEKKYPIVQDVDFVKELIKEQEENKFNLQSEINYVYNELQIKIYQYNELKAKYFNLVEAYNNLVKKYDEKCNEIDRLEDILDYRG